MLKAIIFDVDGTLAETEEAHRHAFNEMFAQWGLAWHWDRALYHKLLDVGGSKERIMHYALSMKPEGFEVVQDNMPNLVKMHQQKTEIYSQKVSSGQVSLRPGVGRLIEECLSAGVKLGIATTTNLAPLQALFSGTLGLDVLAYFEGIAAGDMAQNKKPAPDLYLMALEQLGLPAKSCIAIEDSRNGLEAAIQAGLLTFITVNDYTCDQSFPEALAVLSDLGEPDKHFQPIAGQAKQSGFVSLDLARSWHKIGLEMGMA